VSGRLSLISRAERLVAGGRVVLAVFSLTAVIIDPFEPARIQTQTYSLLAIYACYAVLLAARTFSSVVQRRWWMIATHVIDLAVFSLVIFATEGPTSPFFVFFVFVLFCATLRFGSKGTLYTAAVALLIFLAMGFWSEFSGDDAELEPSRFMIRTVYLLVVTALLFHLGRHQEVVRRELGQISVWPRAVGSVEDDVVAALLQQAARMLRVPRVMLFYTFEARRRVIGGESKDDSFTIREASVDSAQYNLLEARAANGVFLRRGGKDPLWLTSSPTVDGESENPFDERARASLGIESALVASFHEGSVRGSVVFLDREAVAEEDLSLAVVVAGFVGSRIDQFLRNQKLRSAAVAEERVRLARDLHDSLLQSLTGAALQLQTLHRLMQTSPGEARERISEIQAIIGRDQRELRTYIDQLQESPSPAGLQKLHPRLMSLADRFRRQWDLSLGITVDPTVDALSEGIKHEIYSIVNEAVSNAAKHAQAANVIVDVAVAGDHVHIKVDDDGEGFPFRGQYDLETLVEMRRGPVTLKERVASLGGNLLIDSSGSGASVEVTVPVGGKATP
jgi:signal transduction histidine kinase